MDARHLTMLRKILADRIQQLQTTLTRLQEELRVSSPRFSDAADQASASYGTDALQRQAEQASRQLRLLNDALRRMNADDYGDCMMCGNTISPARLKAVPWARYCRECQELQERVREHVA